MWTKNRSAFIPVGLISDVKGLKEHQFGVLIQDPLPYLILLRATKGRLRNLPLPYGKGRRGKEGGRTAYPTLHHTLSNPVLSFWDPYSRNWYSMYATFPKKEIGLTMYTSK